MIAVMFNYWYEQPHFSKNQTLIIDTCCVNVALETQLKADITQYCIKLVSMAFIHKLMFKLINLSIISGFIIWKCE